MVSKNLKNILGGEEGQPGDIELAVSSIRKISEDLSEVTGSIRDMVGQEKGEGAQSGLAEVRNTVKDLNRSLAALADIMEKVERGEGTVGKLLADEAMAAKVNEAVLGASDAVASITSVETHVDLGTWYNFQKSRSYAALGLRIQPNPSKYYLLEVVSDGGGTERLSSATDTPYGNRITIIEQDNTIRLTAMFAKRFFEFLDLRAGLIENSGGVSAQLVFFDERIALRTDLFNFGMPANEVDDRLIQSLPRWRTLIKAQPYPNVYLTAGVDDVLNFSVAPQTSKYGLDFFVGAGLSFQDEDLRSVLPFVSSF